jgi:hypothetical protein
MKDGRTKAHPSIQTGKKKKKPEKRLSKKPHPAPRKEALLPIPILPDHSEY